MARDRIYRARQHGRRHGREPGQGGARRHAPSIFPRTRCSAPKADGCARAGSARGGGGRGRGGGHHAAGRQACPRGLRNQRDRRRAQASAILIDCSTIDVATAREESEKAAAAGYEMVDAPVSGGIAAADAGTLTFMVGGTRRGVREGAALSRAHGQGGDPRRRAPARARPPRSATTCCSAPRWSRPARPS